MEILTDRLKLVLQTHEQTLVQIEAMSPDDRAHLSADWIARIADATTADPWTHGFSLVLRTNDIVLGQCGFKGPPDSVGVVEIAYGVSPEHEGNGYGAEAARALTEYAFQHEQVCLVRAHTFQESNASARILNRNGFRLIGEVMDPEDGPVWRWERTR